MISRYEVTLGSAKMSAIDQNLLILDVQYSGIDIQRQEYTVANLDGYDIARTYHGKQTVTVSFALRIYDIAKRNEACQKVNEWANSSTVLKVNDRKDQFLTVHCEQYATVSSVRDWTEPLTVVFATDYVPFWQSVEYKTLTLSGTNPKGTLKLDGNVGSALVNVDITADVAIKKAATIEVGSTRIELDDIPTGEGQKIVISYTKNRYIKITVVGSSALRKVKGTSSDLLLAKCGASTNVSITTGSKVTAVIKARGLWL